MQEEEYGQLTQAGDRVAVRFRRRVNHSPEKAWKALTEPDQLAGWFPTTIEGELASGSPLSFSFRAIDIPPMDGEMLAFDPPRLLEFRWGPDDLRFELEPDGDGCVLMLTDTYAEVGKGARDAAGWHVCLQGLARLLNGEDPVDEGPDHWRSINARYQELFGPEASTVGPPQEWEDAQGSVE
jgi:uncharacterized protein YndB with AHSA1/START domain